MFKIVNVSDLEINLNPWLIRQILPSESLCMIGGSDGVLNSICATELSQYVATGESCHGSKVKPSKPVVYVGNESPITMANRRRDFNDQHNIRKDSPYYMFGGSVDLRDIGQYEQLARDLRYQLKRTGYDEYPGLIVIDIQQSFDEEADDMKFINQVIRGADYLRAQTGATILLVHNLGSNEQSSGYSALFSAVDAAYRVEEMTNSSRLRLICTKMKDHMKPKPIELRSNFQSSEGV